MNQLTKVRLKNFKSIRKMELPLTPLNVMIGANGAGKSNFVGFFKMLEAISTQRLEEYAGLQSSSPGFFFYGNRNYGIDCELGLSLNGQPVTYGFVLKPNNEDQLVFVEERIVYEDKNYSLGSGHHESHLYTDSGNKIRNKLSRQIGDLIRQWQVFQFHETSQMRGTHYIHDNLVLLGNGANLAPYLMVIKEKHPNHYRRIVRTIQLIMPYFRDFELEPLRLDSDRNRLDWREVASNARFSSVNFSDGSLRFAALATLLLQPMEMMPSLVLIDEPELGLHPMAVRLLASMIKAVAVSTQVILATQSKTLVDEFSPEDVVVLDRQMDDETGYFSSTFRRLDTAALEQWLHEYKLGDIWDKDLFGGRP